MSTLVHIHGAEGETTDSRGIRCPKCGSDDLEVVKTHLLSNARKRQRRCVSCKYSPINTVERLIQSCGQPETRQ